MEEFIRCYEEIYPRMYKTAYYYLKNAEEAKDAVQDAALISYEKWGQLRGKRKVCGMDDANPCESLQKANADMVS